MRFANHRRVRLALLAAAGSALVLSACGGGDDGSPGAAVVGDPGAVHVHSLGVNPSDGALFVATHTGLFRAAEGEQSPTRIADRYQDTMGFTVVGPDRFLGSGHPDGREDLPPFLGLIESDDAGDSWQSVSLQGRWDFHLLEADGLRVYGFGSNFETREEALLVSLDRGDTWVVRSTPASLTSLAMHPRDPDRLVASSLRRLYASSDAGQSWRRLPGGPGLLAWAEPDSLYSIADNGSVRSRAGAGGPWRAVGRVAGGPAAFTAEEPADLYVALHDGTVERSTDGGVSWAVRSMP